MKKSELRKLIREELAAQEVVNEGFSDIVYKAKIGLVKLTNPKAYAKYKKDMSTFIDNEIADVQKLVDDNMFKKYAPGRKKIMKQLAALRLAHDKSNTQADVILKEAEKLKTMLNDIPNMKKYGTDKPDLRKNKEDPNELAFAWIVDFPLFEEEKTEGNYAPMHHMFTQPKADDLRFLNKKNAHKVKSYQHDLVLNGFEVGGGSVRIHDAEIQKKIFDLIGFSDEQKKYFEHMLTAFKYGVPPHGGIAPGIDRLIMVLLGQPSLREVIAFPKNKEAKDVLMDAPSFVDKKQLKDVSIKSDLPKKEKR